MVRRVAPAGKLDLAAAASLHSELGALSGQDVELDLSAATQIGALCLQVLIAACKTAASAGKTFRIVASNDRIDANLCAMGMDCAALTEDMI